MATNLCSFYRLLSTELGSRLRAAFGRWSRTTRNASDALDAGKPINWKNSHFTHALHDNNHVTTVRDWSLLRVESYRNPIAPPTTAELSTAVFFIATHG